jgi:carbon monoxide dehydrogenase subunit G
MYSKLRKHSVSTSLSVACLLIASAWLGVGPAKPVAALASDSRAFSSEEERALREGQLVVRRSEVVRGQARLIGGLSWQLVHASPERVWRALRDVRTYHRFLPAVEEARFVEYIGREQRLFIKHRMGFINASYFVLASMNTDGAKGRIAFRLDHSRPSSIRDAFGELRVTPYPDGKSVVSLAILADVGEGLLRGLVRSNVHEWMLRVPEQLKKFVERGGADVEAAAVSASAG